MLHAGPVPGAPLPGSVHLRQRMAGYSWKIREAIRGGPTPASKIARHAC